MKLFLLGRRHSVNAWLEDAAAAFTAAGHTVLTGHVRRPPIPLALERPMWPARGEALARAIARAEPELVLVIGGFHIPTPILEAVAGAPGRPPLAGWVGDAFGPEAAPLAQRYDAIGFTDTALVARASHQGFGGAGFFLPHAADPSGDWPQARRRDPRMVFVANPTPLRRAVAAQLSLPMVLVGPGWGAADGPHERLARRVPPARVRSLYGAHAAALNIRNEEHVLAGLNQRSFAPPLAGAALVADAQPDLELCFEPGEEVAVWRDVAELEAIYARLLAEPAEAERLASAARRRILAAHTFAHRLATLVGALNI
ncbi:MAG TPA: glycosyltransferase [Caulobacteraceae bacterium]|nr:glycosyltransferase [Caulobacteraceae bacterium]